MTHVLKRVFHAHPASVGETYGEHAGIAFHFGRSMLAGGLACLVHGLLPFLFQSSASRRIRRLHRELTEREEAFRRSRRANADTNWPLEYEI